jgi:lipopolysaccharide biosynthesis protein
MGMISVMCHLYYHHLWDEISASIAKIKDDKLVYVNLTDDQPNDNIINKIKSKFPNATILVSRNQGKDIGGNLRLVGQWMEDGSPGELMILCHSKTKNTEWRRDLLNGSFNNYATFLFRNSAVGMAGHVRWLFQRGSDVNSRYYNNYCMRFGLKNLDMRFIAGTIFCVRSSIFKDFFSSFNAIELANELEIGDVSEPSKTHAWERLYGEIVRSAGYLIKPVEYFQELDEPILNALRYYDEDYYLEKYPDVKKMVTNTNSSGLFHYLKYGINESRIISEKIEHFDEKYYLSNNADVAAAVKRGEFKSGREHYLRHGHKEHRKLAWK